MVLKTDRSKSLSCDSLFTYRTSAVHLLRGDMQFLQPRMFRKCRSSKHSCKRLIVLSLIALVLIPSCTPLFRTKAGISDMRIQKKDNGYLVEFACNNKVGDITAFISSDDWLVITLVGISVDFDRLRSMPPNDLYSSVQVVGYRTSIQVTLKLRQKFRSCQIFRNPSNDDVGVALFQ